MYLDFFDLDRPPFNVTPDSDLIYYSENHFEALSQMIYGVQERKGFVVVTGPVGTGKTTLSRAFLRELGDDTSTALILNSRMNADELLHAIVDDFGLEPPEDPTTKQLVDCLNEFLLEEFHEGRNVCVLIDESQNLSPEALENLRLLSNLETEQDKLLQIVLVGQPELNDVLNRRELRQLKQRINVWVNLSNLTAAETREYVEHRLEEAGNADLSIEKTVFDRLHEETGGNPRSINLLMDRTLLAAYVDEERTIRTDHLHQALDNLAVSSGEDDESVGDPRAFSTADEPDEDVDAWSMPDLATSVSIRSGVTALAILLAIGFLSWTLWRPAFTGGDWPNEESPGTDTIQTPTTSSPEPADSVATAGNAGGTAPVLSDTFPNPFGVQPIGDLPDEPVRRDYGSLLMARFLSYQMGRTQNPSGSEIDLSNGDFRTQVTFDSLMPQLVPGRWLQFNQSSERPVTAGYPAFLSWSDELGFRYLLYVPESEVLWDPLRGTIDAKRVGSFDGWAGLVKIPTRSRFDPQRVYRSESGGSSVAQLQRLLNEATDEKVPSTGRFGPVTESAVRRFQEQRGLSQDGVAGPRTNLALLSEAGVQFTWSRREVESFVDEVRR